MILKALNMAGSSGLEMPASTMSILKVITAPMHSSMHAVNGTLRLGVFSLGFHARHI
jgi:hypothetical protein